MPQTGKLLRTAALQGGIKRIGLIVSGINGLYEFSQAFLIGIVGQLFPVRTVQANGLPR